MGAISLKESLAGALSETYGRVVGGGCGHLVGDLHSRGRRFHHLEWRLQAALATRSLLSQVEPKVVTRLVLEKETGVEEEVLEMGGDSSKHGARAEGGRPERRGRHIGG